MKPPKSIQLSIPQPCHEDWGKMTPQDQGRFCDSCQKCVVDFTGFTDEQLYRFFAEHRGQKVCGRVTKTQLNRTITLPPQPHSQLYKWIIAAGMALVFTTTGTAMFAKSPFACEQYYAAGDDSVANNNSISGRITNANGKNIRDIKVTISEGGKVIQETFTNEHGEYVFSDISAGRFEISAEGNNYRKHTVTSILYSTLHPIEVNLELKKGNKTNIPTESAYRVPEIDKYQPGKYQNENQTFISGDTIQTEILPGDSVNNSDTSRNKKQ